MFQLRAPHAATALFSWIVGACSLACLSGCLSLSGTDADGTSDPADDARRGHLAVRADDYVLGDLSAPVTVIEYGDFECPVCGAFAREVFPELERRYIETGRVRWVFRHFPLRAIHANADAAARAAHCAATRDRFWEYHDALFADQSDLSPDALNRHAEQLGLDVGAHQVCRDSRRAADRVQGDIASGAALGVTGTPTFFVDGELIAGYRTVDEFAAILDAKLAGR